MFPDDTAPTSSTASDLVMRSRPPLFRLGHIVATRAVLMHLEKYGILADTYLFLHVRGEWGEVPPEDAEANRRAVQHGARILSAYVIAEARVWLITEADRSATTLLFPEEY
jgi:hypothetical protein